MVPTIYQCKATAGSRETQTKAWALAIHTPSNTEDTGEDTCKSTNKCGSRYSTKEYLNICFFLVGAKDKESYVTCSSDANPPVESYTWFKVDESTPVGSGQQYSITNIRSEDGGQYYNEQSLVYTAVTIVSVCGAMGLFCLVFFMIKKWKTTARWTSQARDFPVFLDYVNIALGGQSDAIQPSLNLNTTQPDGVYQSLNPNTTQPDAVYQSLNPNTIQPDAVYQTLNANTP
ncbi:uncharacterized protein LOC143099143 [Alosa pseudoharengus]|uniref:uncharacterized protein LOC143099142 n=1 Tax=Alosa pseudoharengus TaxID=34774 RepID=UPI003F8C1F5E